MGVRIDIGLDLEGNHTFEWQRSDDRCALSIPQGTLERWSDERQAFVEAQKRWRRVMEEVDEVLFEGRSQNLGDRLRQPTAAGVGLSLVK